MVVARRYARALYEEAERVSKVERVDADLALVRATLEESEALEQLFRNPIVAREKKHAVVRALFETRLDDLTLRFLDMLVGRQRESLFVRIAQAWRSLHDERLGIVEAEARVASEFSEEERAGLTEALEQLTGKKIRLNVRKDAGLIGGLVVRIGDTVYDRSVRHQLEALRDRVTLRPLSMN